MALIIGSLVLMACGQPRGNIADFEACVLAGYPVMESSPRRCAVPNGPTFTEELPPVAAPAIEDFRGPLQHVESDSVAGETWFSFGESVDAFHDAVLEPDAVVTVAGTDDPVNLNNVAIGTPLRVEGWMNEDGVVHAITVEVGQE